MTGSLRLVGALDWSSGAPIDVTLAGGRIGGGAAAEALDAGGLIAAPGFIDLQVNGAFGHDFTSDPASIWEVGARLPRYGVTAFLPTLVSAPGAVVAAARRVLAAGPPPGWRGALPLGLHVEGPMIAPSRRGAHPPGTSSLPDPALLATWGGLEGVRLVTLAPELPGAREVTRLLRGAGIVVAAGHSDADFEAAVASFRWGIGYGTHLFNAMSGLDHRRPGLAAALLATPSVPAGIIADGEHVHPGMVAAAHAAKGARGITLVTDCTAAAGEAEGRHLLGSRVVAASRGRVTDEEGRLAGSLLTMDVALRNYLRFTGCTAAEAIRTAAATPAAVLGDPERGSINAGRRADLTLLDRGLEVRATLVAGEVVYSQGFP